MRKESFAEKVKEKMSSKDEYKGHTGVIIYGKKYSHIFKHRKYNFIDEKYPVECDIKGNRFSDESGEKKKIGYHRYARSLNSSQAVCINFFKKFFDKGHEEWEKYLIEAFKENGVPISGSSIKNAVFEYVKDSKEETNFDFYVEMDDGSCIYMEIKYTEDKFNGPDKRKNYPQKYYDKWDEIYSKYVKDCPYLDENKCTREIFLDDYLYQINRNVCHAKEGDVVLFITPKKNDASGINKGREYIDKVINNSHVMNIYWEDLVEKLMEIINEEPELKDYYGKFKKKYIDILQEI